MITTNWTSLRPHAVQSELWKTPAKFVGVVAGRGSGKTELARRRIVRYLAVSKPWPDPIYLYALPTYNQAKRVAWKALKELVPKSWLKGSPSESDLTITTVFGSTLHVMGMDKPERAEGVQWDGIVLDESSDLRPGVFNRSLLPALSHRDPWCWRIGVPKRYGVGAAEFKDFWDDCARRNAAGDTRWAAFWWPSSEILTPEQINVAQEHLDSHDYNEQYKAHWLSVSGCMFHAFDPVMNVDDTIEVDHRKAIMIGSDFNVDPMAWVIGQRITEKRVLSGRPAVQQAFAVRDRSDTRLNIIDQVWKRNTNTQQCLDLLAKRFADHKAGFEFYGDATGRARKTSASSSDYVQIKNHKFFGPRSKVYYPKANPLVVNRIASCNAMFNNAKGERRCFVHPRCTNLLKDLASRSWKPGTTTPDDSGDIGHITDALGYLIHYCFPLIHVTYDKTPEIIIA